MFDIDDWRYRHLKGRIANYVARGNDKPDVLIKATRTIVSKHGIGHATLERMLEEVNRGSVRPFLRNQGSMWHQPERLERFTLLKSSLLDAAEKP